MEIKLTAQQIEHIDEITCDIKAADATLKMALRNHSNRINELSKLHQKWWDDLAKTHGLDFKETTYEIKVIRGAVVVAPEEIGKDETK
jgi:hypothetical protein